MERPDGTRLPKFGAVQKIHGLSTFIRIVERMGICTNYHAKKLLINQEIKRAKINWEQIASLPNREEKEGRLFFVQNKTNIFYYVTLFACKKYTKTIIYATLLFTDGIMYIYTRLRRNKVKLAAAVGASILPSLSCCCCCCFFFCLEKKHTRQNDRLRLPSQESLCVVRRHIECRCHHICLHLPQHRTRS